MLVIAICVTYRFGYIQGFINCQDNIDEEEND